MVRASAPGGGPVTQLRDAGACGGEVVFSGSREDSPFTAPPAECGCQCGFAKDVCTRVEIHTPGSCALDGLTVTATADLCEPLDDDVRALEPVLGTASGAMCVSDEGASTTTPASFDESFDGCKVVSDLACGEGVCLPDDGATYCVLSEGATACPADFGVAHRLVDDGDFLDTRACACDCPGPAGAVTCLAPAIKAYADTACAGAEIALGPGPVRCRRWTSTA
jgi:hypothetical protein